MSLECSVTGMPQPTTMLDVFSRKITSWEVHEIESGEYAATILTNTDSVPAGQMGPNLVALIAYLSGRYHLSIRNIQDYLREHWQLSFSLGAISQA